MNITLTPDIETRVRRNTHRIVGENPAHTPCLPVPAYAYLFRKLCTGTPKFASTKITHTPTCVDRITAVLSRRKAAYRFN